MLPASALAKHHKAWSVDSASSSVNFISIKNNLIGETHSFKTISGTLNETGQLTISIDLASVETNIDIRNTRMQEHLFKTNTFANATITADVSNIAYSKLKKGQSLTTEAPFMLDLHGKKVPLNANVIITRQADTTLTVTTTQPILLTAAAFGLQEGIDKLMALAGLNAIASSVPVSVVLKLQKN